MVVLILITLFMSVFNLSCAENIETVIGKRYQCVALRAEGLSLREISARVGKSTTFVKGALDKATQEMSLKDRPRSGRPRILDDRDEHVYTV